MAVTAEESPTGTRARRKAETRRALLDAATDVFLEQHPATAPLEEVAARAGVSKATLFFHFGTRSDLLAALATELYVAAAAEDAVDGDTLRAYVERYLARQRRPQVRLLWQVGDLLGDRPELLDLAFRHLAGELTRRLRGPGRPRATVARTVALLTPAVMFTARRAATGLAPPDELDAVVDAADRLTRSEDS